MSLLAKARGEQAVEFVVFFNIRIQQIKRHAANTDFPNLGGDIAIWEFDLNGNGFIILCNKADWQMFKSQRIVNRILPAVFADALGKISHTWKQRPQVMIQRSIIFWTHSLIRILTTTGCCKSTRMGNHSIPI